MVPLCPKQILGLVETRAHAALAMPATRAALGAIFQASPLCLCEPRLPRGEMQAVPCGTRSNTRLLPASTSQPPPYTTAACAAGVGTKTTDRDSLRYTYNGTRRVRQLALGCESS